LDVLSTSWHTDFSLTSPVGSARFFALTLNLLFRYAYRDVWFTRGSDVVIATSDSDVGKYKMLYGLRQAQIRKVYNGIDTKLFSPSEDRLVELRQELRLDRADKVILALARLEKDKGVQNAIAVMPRLIESARVCLIVVGDGDYRPALQAQARRLGVSDHVRFVGARPLAECARYFNLCDVFVDPTLRTDGYDLTIAEAMACAKPVIASDVGANSTLVDSSARDGILIPRGDQDALSRQVVRLLSAPGLGSEMGAAARTKIASRFSIQAMVEGMESVYAEWAGR
jgi:glycosyltransferase involved in cell wall biosynthesis